MIMIAFTSAPESLGEFSQLFLEIFGSKIVSDSFQTTSWINCRIIM